MIIKQSYADRMDSITMFDNSHDEFAVLDRAGRVQLPKEYLEKLGVQGNKVRLEYQDGKIIIDAPKDEENTAS